MDILCISRGEDKSFISKKEMEESIIGLLGGRIAEEIILRRYINRSK